MNGARYLTTGVFGPACPHCDEGVSTERGRFIDINFTRFYAIDLVKIAYVIGMAALLFFGGWLLLYGIQAGKLALLMPYLIFVLPLGWIALRIACELVIAVFKIAGLMQDISENERKGVA